MEHIIHFFTNFYNHLFTWGVFENLWSGFLVVVLGYFITQIPKKRKMYRFFGFHRNFKLNVYLSALFVQDKKTPIFSHMGFNIPYKGPVVPECEFIAISFFSRIFNLISRGDNVGSSILNKLVLGDVSVNYLNSPASSENIEHRNCICLGSATTNSMTDLYTSRNETILSFCSKTCTIKSKDEIIGDPKGGDYAILEKIYDKETGIYVFVAAGMGISGTLAAVYYLTENWKKLEKKYKHKEFALCLRSCFYDQNPEGYKNAKIVFQNG
ncbi:hypothetical protein [Candidatus Uabimicrobium sp. HlEnr_7]|uniref:hypothetical protein n=1 Tax=Candidatus Uabimicrobium helgolandensis TaxID=3095367 RepID=UPI0035580EA6